LDAFPSFWQNVYLFIYLPLILFFSEAASSANGIAIVEARDLPVFFSGVFFFYSFLFSCFFWPLKRRSIMAGNGGRDKKRKCSRKKIRKGVGSHRAFT